LGAVNFIQHLAKILCKKFFQEFQLHKMKKLHFFYKLIPPRPNFHLDMSEKEKSVWILHADYWKELVEKGMAIIYGRPGECGERKMRKKFKGEIFFKTHP
jgi:hypothetical protein